MSEYKAYYKSPVGWLVIEANDEAVTRVEFAKKTDNKKIQPNIHTVECVKQLTEYFNGKRVEFDLPINPEGTDFQKSVWKSMLDIPFGKTVAYSDLANAINNPKSVRAIGMANNKNKIVIVVPCHRVIGKNGNLTGFGGGMDKKIWLLEHEGIKVNNEKLKINNDQYRLL